MEMDSRSRGEKFVLELSVIVLLLYLFVPQIAIVLFAFAKKWNGTFLPEGYTLEAFTAIFTDSEFKMALLRSIIAAFLVAIIDVTVVVLALFYTTITKNKKLENIMEILSIIPVALPGIVQALGIIKLYGVIAPKLLATPFLLILAQAAFSLPLCFWTLKNMFAGSNISELYNAACTLGVSDLDFVFHVLFPCMKEGIFASAVMSATCSFGDYALAHMIVGSAWETLPVLQNEIMKLEGHEMSAMAIIGNMVIVILLVLSAEIKQKKVIRK